MKAVVAAFNQEKALVGAFSVITNLRMELFEALIITLFYFDGALHTLHLERRKYFTAAWFIQIGGFLVVGLQLK